jgi:hypothetical protein
MFECTLSKPPQVTAENVREDQSGDKHPNHESGNQNHAQGEEEDDNQKRAKHDCRDKTSERSRLCEIGALSATSDHEDSYSGFAALRLRKSVIGRDDFRFGSRFPALRCPLVRQ